MKRIVIAALALLSLGTDSAAVSQALPPPRDGDIRVLYYELQNLTTVWLTLEPKATSGTPAPPLMLLTLNFSFPGKFPKDPPQQVDMQAYAGLLWAPQIRLSVSIDDGAPVDLVQGTVGLSSGGQSDFLQAPVSTGMLRRIAAAKRVRINALGVELELTKSQRAAVGLFLTRILSDNPGAFSR
jgi:hypothetical protein